MLGMSWVRIVLCGYVAGVVCYLLSALSLPLFAQDFLTFMQRGGPHTRWDGVFFFGIDLMMGIWAMWLYSVITPRYGAGPKTAAIAGLAWWTIKSLQSAKWVGLGFVPEGIVLVPLATSLITIVVASGIGAWLYEKVEMSAAKALPQR